MNHTKDSFDAFAKDSLARASARRDEVAGLPEDAGAEAVARARGNDLPNAAHVIENSKPPEFLLRSVR